MAPMTRRRRTTLGRLQKYGRVDAYYDQADDSWHERLLLKQLGQTRCIIVTPHFDLYAEELSEAIDVREPCGGVGGIRGNVLRIDMAEFRRRQEELEAAA
eukprot:2163894-Pyramimonas_sp.AAC.1